MHHTTNQIDIKDTLQACGQGMLAGTLGTLTMTAAMKAIHCQLPAAEQYPIPPKQIFEDVTASVGLEDQIGPAQTDAGWIAAHFGYGAVGGAAYNVLAQRCCRPGTASGALFGLAVWGASYLGWLPACGMRSRATAEPAGRNAMMIASHLVWGATTGALCSWIDSQSQKSNQTRKTEPAPRSDRSTARRNAGPARSR